MRAVRRWVLRLLALVALGGVAYGVYTIVREGTEGTSRADRGPIQPALQNLADSQEALAVRLENLRPGRRAPRLVPAIRAALRDRDGAVAALHKRQAAHQPIPDERALDAALGAEFDYLDALLSVARNRRSPLLRSLGGRAETAKDAFTDLPDSAGVEDGIRGTQAFIVWARARR